MIFMKPTHSLLEIIISKVIKKPSFDLAFPLKGISPKELYHWKRKKRKVTLGSLCWYYSFLQKGANSQYKQE